MGAWEGQVKRGDMGVLNIKSMGHDSVMIFKMYSPCRACLLNSSIYMPLRIIRILPNPDGNLGSTSVWIKPVHLYFKSISNR